MEYSPANPYAGLLDITALCWKAQTDQIHDVRMADLVAHGGGTEIGIIDILWSLLRTLSGFLDPGYWTQILFFNAVWPLIQQAYTVFTLLSSGLITGLLNTLRDVFDKNLYSLLSPIWSAIAFVRDSIYAIPAFISQIIQLFLSRDFDTWIMNKWKYIKYHLLLDLPVLASVYHFIESLPGRWAQFKLWVFSTALQAWVWIITLPARASAWVNGAINTVLNFLVNFPSWIAQTSVAVFKLILAEAWAWLGPMLLRAWTMIGPTVNTIVNYVLPIGLSLVRSLFTNLESLPTTIVEWGVSSIGTDLALHPATAVGAAMNFYGIALAAGAGAHTLSTALNLIPTLNWVGASQLAALVAELAAFGPITGALYGSLITDAIAVPMKYHWNEILRPQLPGLGTIEELRYHRAISRSEYFQAMARYGFPNYWITKVFDNLWTNPNLRQLMQMSEPGLPDVEWYQEKITELGYSDDDIPRILDLLRKRAIATPISQYKSAVRAMVRAGYWKEGDQRAALQPLGVREEESHLSYVAAELDYQNSWMDDQVKYYCEQFRKKQISSSDLALSLSTIIIRPERVAQEVARETTRALPNPKPAVPLTENPLVVKIRNQAITSWIDRYRKWEISDQDLLLALTIIVRDQALAQQMLNAELTRFRPVPTQPTLPEEDPIVAASRRQAIASWVAAFRDGKIDSATLEVYLVPLIPNAGARTQIVDLESLRYNPTPDLIVTETDNAAMVKVQAEYIRGHIAMFAARLLGLDELYNYLIADGLVADLARATVITQASKRIRIPALSSDYYSADAMAALSAAGLGDQERGVLDGSVTVDSFKAWLAGLVRDESAILYLADQLELERWLESH